MADRPNDMKAMANAEERQRNPDKWRMPKGKSAGMAMKDLADTPTDECRSIKSQSNVNAQRKFSSLNILFYSLYSKGSVCVWGLESGFGAMLV